MSAAKSVSQRRVGYRDNRGHELFETKLETEYGVATVRSESPTDPLGEDVYFLGGLVSGGSYREARCSVVSGGRTGHMVLHGNNGGREAIQACAGEAVTVVTHLSHDTVVHLVAHSKAARVGLRAAVELGNEVEPGKLVLVNPAVNRQPLPGPLRAAGILAEGVAVSVTHPVRMAHSVGRGIDELVHRPLGVMSELVDILRHDETAADWERIHEQGWQTVLVTGSFDHVVRQNDDPRASSPSPYDLVVQKHGPVAGSHLGMMVDSHYLDGVF